MNEPYPTEYVLHRLAEGARLRRQHAHMGGACPFRGPAADDVGYLHV